MDLGVVTRSFPKLNNVETAELLRSNGFRWTELCFSQTDSKYWVYNGRSDLSDMTNERSATVVDTYRSRGIEVPALGVFTNLIEPDDSELEKNLHYFRRMMEIAAYNRIPFVSTECGFIPGQRGINADVYEERFQRFVDSMSWLVQHAAEHGVCVALEPCVLDVVPSAKRTADLINQIGSDRLKVLLDPANLIANSSESDMFAYLTDHIAYFHGKDRKLNDKMGRVVGDGDIDWVSFLTLYHKHCDGFPFIFEYVNSDNFLEIRDRALQFDSQT